VTAGATARAASPLDVGLIRRDFPLLSREVNGRPIAYLDNAATSQKPQATIDAISNYYRTANANIHRGVHTLSVEATEAYESARAKVQRFLGAARPEEIIFVRSATEAINLVAGSYGRANVGAGDEVIVSTMEHHSNIVPWQLLCKEVGATLRVVPINDAGELIVEEYERLLSPRTKLVALTHVSNALGTINPVKRLVDIAQARGVPVLLDGAQAAPHLAVDVAAIGCDFYAVAGHKMFGPTGIGVLYGRHEMLEAMPPYQGGGEMILSVTFEGTTFNAVPHKFEAGTPNIAGAIALGSTIDYLQNIGMDRIEAWEHELLTYGTEVLEALPGIRLIGTAAEKASVISFVVDGVHAHDVGTILDQEGVAVRTGHHCAQPVMERFGLTATTRASFAFYNTREEIDRLARGLQTVRKVFG